MCRCSRFTLFLALAALMSNLQGCATLQLPFGKRIPKATATDPATQILCLWQPGEGQDPNGMPCKGFQGQILFLSSRKAVPVQIEGEITIYLFDDQGTPEEQSKPIHKYVFDHGSWAIHLANTAFGPAYSVFVPYPKHEVKEANCALRVRLKPKQGPTVFSDFVNMQLGNKQKILRDDDAKPSTIEDIDRVMTDAMSDMLRRTTTIPIAPNSESIEPVSATSSDSELNKVQFASHQVTTDSEKPTPEAQRIRQLELMVQRLLEQQDSRSAAGIGERDSRVTEPARLAENSSEATNQPGGRLKVGRLRDARLERESTESRPVMRRQPHPLDDDSAQPQPPANDENLAREPAIGDPFDFPPQKTSRE